MSQFPKQILSDTLKQIRCKTRRQIWCEKRYKYSRKEQASADEFCWDYAKTNIKWNPHRNMIWKVWQIFSNFSLNQLCSTQISPAHNLSQFLILMSVRKYWTKSRNKYDSNISRKCGVKSLTNIQENKQLLKTSTSVETNQDVTCCNNCHNF